MIHRHLRHGIVALLCGAVSFALAGAAAAQDHFNARSGGNSSAPTGTQGVVGNPNCPPPVINGITPKNWSCKTGEGSSYTVPQTTNVRPGPNYGPPGSYLVQQPGPPGSYLQKDVGPPGSYIQPDVGPPGSYLNSTGGGTQVRTGPGGAIILSPGAPANSKDTPKAAARNQTPTPGVTEPYRQDRGAMRGVYSTGGGSPYANGGGSPYRQDTVPMRGGVVSNGYSFGPQNSGAQAAQGLASLIGAGMAQAAAAKAANAKTPSAKKAAAANAQAAQAINGFIRMLGSEPGAP